MAVNKSRSLNAELDEGSLDGKYRQQRPNWGGAVEPATERDRLALHPSYYGTFAEAPVQIRPDGRTARRSR